MKKFSVTIAKKHTTSISLEEDFYEMLKELAREKNVALNNLITEIDKDKKTNNLSSALRLYVLHVLMEKLNKK